MGLQWGRRPRTAEMQGPKLKHTRSLMLQWGRRPRTAEISPSWLASPSWATLQWGRRPRTAEMPTRSGHGSPRSGFNGAAVRGRRKSAHGRRSHGCERASMGPPSEDGGNLTPEEIAAWKAKRLQWGRRPRTAEIRRSPSLYRQNRGFNGAAVRGRRKCDGENDAGRDVWASMGPPSEDGGNTSS